MLNRLGSLKTTRRLGELIREGAFGILPPGDSYVTEGGIRFLRPTEMKSDNQIDWDSCLRAPSEFARHRRARIKKGDVLVAVKGATIASDKSICTIKTLDEPTIVNGSIFRFQTTAETSPDFLLEVLSSDFVKKQMKGAMILNNAVDYLGRTIICDILIPLPSKEIQEELAKEMQAARESRQNKLAQADALLAGLDEFILNQLGLTPPEETEVKVFAVRREDLLGNRLDPPAYKPFYAKGKPPQTVTTPLGEVADINANQVPPPESVDELVPYVGLPECELTEVREVVMRPYSEVKGRKVVRPGDILFARIEPSVFNKKYVYAEDLKGHDYAYTSTEFYVVRTKPELLNQLYLYAMFSNPFLFAQVKGKTTGSSGRRRIDLDMFTSLKIPIPELNVQEEIADEVSRRRNKARRLRAEAETEWTEAKACFEAQLLGKA